MAAVIAPITTKGRPFPTRIACRFPGRDGQIVLDQVRTIDKKRLLRKPDQINEATQTEELDRLAEMFAR